MGTAGAFGKSTFGISIFGIEKDDVSNFGISTFGISGTANDGAAGASNFGVDTGVSTLAAGAGMSNFGTSIFGISGTSIFGIEKDGVLKSGTLISGISGTLTSFNKSEGDDTAAGASDSSFAAFCFSTANLCFSFSAAYNVFICYVIRIHSYYDIHKKDNTKTLTNRSALAAALSAFSFSAAVLASASAYIMIIMYSDIEKVISF